jgi:hypothetical protein
MRLPYEDTVRNGRLFLLEIVENTVAKRAFQLDFQQITLD